MILVRWEYGSPGNPSILTPGAISRFGTAEEWRVVGTVVTALGEGTYALDPDFRIRATGRFYVWISTEGFPGGTWVKLDDPRKRYGMSPGRKGEISK